MNKTSQLQRLAFILAMAILMLSHTVTAQGLKASGKKIVDQNGNEVILRGMGLGGWMLQEPYMMDMSGFAVAQWDIKDKIKALIGFANTDEFYNAWHKNHCTRADIDSMAAWGFNSVRLPMHYNLYTLPVEDEPIVGTNTWLEKGFVMTDSLINWCKANHMYVILDLHAAPGGQGKDKAISDYNPLKSSLWESEANRQKTIALWRKLAQRYANEPWVGGYDLINEPNWSFTTGGNVNGCSENTNAPLRQLYVNITNAIREVDTKHMIIVEGNCWGNNYNGFFPVWDNNMALSFHKYWSNNDQGSISGIINLRNQYNIPIWMGESGENSNVWFRDAIQLVENNGIGWAWWPEKKIGSVVNPFTIVKTSDYQTLLNYWNNGGAAPTVAFAYPALMQQAENAKIQHCIYRKDVIDAMFRQIADSTTLPYTTHVIPGNIPAPEYDLGRYGKAYSDADIANYNGSTGVYTAWNTGWIFRNDGVDIETSLDSNPGSNGYNVGWTSDNEWLQYTANVDSTAAYTVNFRFASSGAASKIRLQVNDGDVTGSISLPSTGGYQTWAFNTINDVILYKGQQKIKVFFDKAGSNFSFLNFSLSKKTEEVLCKPVSAETYKQTELVYLNCNKVLLNSSVSANGFTCTINGDLVAIASLTLNPANPYQIILSFNQQLFDIDDIKLNYSGTQVKATDGTLLQTFANLQVKNNRPVNATIAGKIEAEAFTVNQGLVLETTSDIGGGQNVGYTNAGDYLDYNVRVLKTSKYWMEVRVASLGPAGRIEVQQINTAGNILNSMFLDIPVTGGWQVWKSVGAAIDLTAGVCTLRVKIVKPEFNMNWYKFTETSLSTPDNANSVFTVFPNPASDAVSVLIPGSAGQKKTICIRSSNGMIVRKVEVAETEISKKIATGNLSKGLYIIELEYSGAIFRTKLIIE
jgi:hypothetical protein